MPTLYHVRKDGQVVPVKVSIWDGFKGVPDRKAKPKPVSEIDRAVSNASSSSSTWPCATHHPSLGAQHNTDRFQCDCCGKVHVSKDGEKQNKSATAKGGNNKNDGKKGGNDNGGGNKGNFSTSDAETYSPADDAKIIEMKEEGKSWKDILEAIGKTSKSQLTNHYKFDLQPKVEQEKGKKEAEDKKKGEKDADKKGGKQSKSEKHNANQQQESKKNQKDKENGKGKKKASCFILPLSALLILV